MDRAINLESTLGLTLGIAVVASQALAIFFLFGKVLRPLSTKVSSFIRSVYQTTDDFRNHKFYKPWARTRPVIIQDPAHMQELSEASELSQRAVYADIFGFKYNMTCAKIDFDPNEQTAARYRLFARAIKVIGLQQIAALQPLLQSRLERTVSSAMHSRCEVDGWVTLELAPLMRDAASGMLGVYLFGRSLMDEPKFASSLFRYSRDVVKCMGVMQLLPRFLKSMAHDMITQRGQALDVLFTRLASALDSPKSDWAEDDDDLKSITLLHNLKDASKESSYWTNETLVQALIGIWFAASHQPWINLHFVFLELCTRPEYVKLIRDEIKEQSPIDHDSLSRLLVLDSFIKEAVRLNPLDKMSIRRKALKPYDFSHGGPSVAVGEIACVSGWDIMHNETRYPKADEFDGLRFLPKATSYKQDDRTEEMQGTGFTDASKDFPIWGLGSRVCPGRWHAALVIKMVIVHLLTHYEFRLENANASHRWFWESWQMPYESTKVSFRRRKT